MGFIYLMYNKITTKIYVGQTTERIEDRIRKHLSNEHNIELKIDLEKYGKDSFEIYKLAECDDSKLNELEQYYIKLYDSFKNGYNSTIGGGGSFNVYDEELVIRLYRQGESLNSIQEKTGYIWAKINHILNKWITHEIEIEHVNNEVNRQSNKAISLIMMDITGSSIQYIFESKLDAYKFICDEQCKNINIQNFYSRVSIACKSDRICYSHRWKLGEDLDVLKRNIEKHRLAEKECIKQLDKVSINKGNHSKKPSKDELCILISKYTYEDIGRQYGVTGKAVRKWCDSYNITRQTSKKPSKEELEKLLETYSLRQIADLFGVTPSTVSWWKKDLCINKNVNIIIKCIETDREFTTYKDAGAYMKTLYPYTMGDKYVGFEIKKSIDGNYKLHGFTWVII